MGSSNNGDCESSGKCVCKKGFEGFKCEHCSIGYEAMIKNNQLDCISCDSNLTSNNCINTLKNDIQQLQDVSRDYSFDTLKSLPVIKLNSFKDQINKQSERIDYLVEYEQRVTQMISNVSKLVPVLSGQFDMSADVAITLCNRAENTIEKSNETAKNSDLLFHRLTYYYFDLNHIINVVNATRKVKLNNNQCDHFLEQSHLMVTEIKLAVLELNEFHKQVQDQKMESDNLLQNVRNFLNESSIIPLDSELIDRMLRLTNISFDSFEIYEKQFSRPYLQTLEIIARSNQLHDQVQEMYTNASVSIQEMDSKLNQSFSKLELAKQNLTVLSNLYEQFPHEFNLLKTHTIEKLKNTLIRLNPENEEKYAQICRDHSNDLVNKAKQLSQKFNLTILSALKYQNQTTENSYNRITDTIKVIHVIVNEIEEKLQDLSQYIYSEKESDEQAETRNMKSKFLADKALNLNNLHLKQIEQLLDQSKQQIELINNKTFIMHEAKDNIKERNVLLLDIENGLNELANKSQMFKGNMNELFPNTNLILIEYNNKINKFNATITQNYLPRINILKSRKALLDGNFIGEIDKIQTNIENKSKYVKSFEDRNKKMDTLYRKMHRHLNEIITRIRLARQKASSLFISVRNRPVLEFRNLTGLEIKNVTLSSLNTITTSSLSTSTVTSSLKQQSTVNPLTISSTLAPLSTSSSMNRNLIENQILQQQPVIVNCKRSYESDLEPSSVNSVSLTFAINGLDQENSLFLYVGSKYTESTDKYNDFFIIEMVNRQIRFIFNSGNGIQVLTHPLKIEYNNLNLTDEDRWYRAEVLRLATTVHLKVKTLRTNQVQELSRTFFRNESLDLFNGLEKNKTIYLDNVIRAKSGNSIRMDFDKNAEILVGGLPDDWVERKSSNFIKEMNDTQKDLNLYIPNEVKSREMSGCIFELNLDGHNINLWNFKTTTSACVGCKEGISDEKPSNLFRFKGKYSYAMLPQINRYNSLKYLIQISIKTFEENALLFFTCNPETNDHIILSLIDGKIRYQIVSRNNGQIGLDLMTKEKYNSGQWAHIAAERDNLEGFLKVETSNSEQLEDVIHLVPNANPSTNFSYLNMNVDQTNNLVTSANLFTNSRQLKMNLTNQYLFIGGIPLNFSSNQCSSKLQTTNSFNGCMRGKLN